MKVFAAAMRALLLLFLLALLVAPGHAQAPPTVADYRAWLAQPARRAQVASFESFLRRFGVLGVIPTQQLLRTASAWRACGVPFEVPPPGQWGRIIPSLRFIRDEVKPRIGPVEAVSGYRNPRLNRCAAGAPRSAHVGFWGLDLVPKSNISQQQLFARLCALHASPIGRSARFGLGFYGGLRFHVDTKSHRLWGSNNRSGTSPCL
ncbi:hypothetical protein [Sphingomonas sp.]|jgi:hypothetical protein|uniref:hypothetical protein n=1 Tax=Sphingomonas sp. TaxID=28214 RepID=UPI002DE921F0|nr:hypothetical protein [Sphingomonas sp.]